ncbi:MAG: hypothetical protein ACQEVA_12390 [Myxococcota bacterium]
MELFETIIQSLSYIGVLDKLIGLTTTDIAVVYLISKPAFLVTAIIMVATDPREERPKLQGDRPDMRDLLP